MMTQVIVTTPEELKKVVKEAVQEFTTKEEKPLPDTINLTEALKVLEENGFPTSKGKMYKLTSENKVPHRVYGNKLIFSRKELLTWASSQAKTKGDNTEMALTLARSARRKMR